VLVQIVLCITHRIIIELERTSDEINSVLLGEGLGRGVEINVGTRSLVLWLYQYFGGGIMNLVL